MRTLGAVLALALLVGCDGSTTETDAGSDAGGPPPLPETIGPADRPARLEVPSAHDGVTPLPVLVLLHGYGANGTAQDTYFNMTFSARRAGMYLIIPDGTVDAADRRFWNATPACCNFGSVPVDDVAYLNGLLDDLEAIAPVDPERIYFMGHSNGGFMSYRMACEAPERVAAIVSLAGSDFLEDTDCVPTAPVSVLQVHGTLDATIGYEGGSFGGGGFPPAADVVARWAARAGCDATPATGEPIDADSSIGGAETVVTRYEAGCAGATAELWTIEGGAHIPPLTRGFTPAALDWLLAR